MVSISYNAYHDNTDSGINTFILKITKKVADRFGIGLSVGYDAITTATPPSTSDSAVELEKTHEESWESNRFFPTLTGIYDDGNNNVVLGVYYSKEEDYTGHTIFGDYTRQLNMQNTALGLGIAQSFDKWELEGLPEDERRDTQVNVSVAQLLTPISHIQFIYSYIYSDGLIASPYRKIQVGNTIVNEKLPLDRTGNAVAVKLVTLINKPTSAHLSYRYYFDNWKIQSHTAAIELYRDLTDNFTLGGLYRYYTQSEASFTKKPQDYRLNDRYIAVDYKYSDFDSQTAGLALIYDPEWTFFIDWDKIRCKASFDYYWTSKNDHIDSWYGKDDIRAIIFTFSIDYLL